MTLGELAGQLLAADSPWVLAVAGVVFAVTGYVVRRLFASVRRIGGRVGDLERRADSEQTRRRQVERELRRQGIALPYWPPDGPNQEPAGSLARYTADDLDELDDLDDDLTREHELIRERPPVPQYDADERARFARHRR